jgi:hypothetical protein
LHFGICDDMLGLSGEPFGITGRQHNRGPMKRRPDEWLPFAAVLDILALAHYKLEIPPGRRQTFSHPSSRFNRSFFSATRLDLNFGNQV